MFQASQSINFLSDLFSCYIYQILSSVNKLLSLGKSNRNAYLQPYVSHLHELKAKEAPKLIRGGLHVLPEVDMA